MNVNDTHIRCLIYVKSFLEEKGKGIEILIDTGSLCNVKSKLVCKRLGLILQTSNHVLFGFNGLKSVDMGSVLVACKIGKWQCPLEFTVVEHPSKTILGYAKLKQLKLTINWGNDNLQDGKGS